MDEEKLIKFFSISLIPEIDRFSLREPMLRAR